MKNFHTLLAIFAGALVISSCSLLGPGPVTLVASEKPIKWQANYTGSPSYGYSGTIKVIWYPAAVDESFDSTVNYSLYTSPNSNIATIQEMQTNGTLVKSGIYSDFGGFEYLSSALNWEVNLTIYTSLYINVLATASDGSTVAYTMIKALVRDNSVEEILITSTGDETKFALDSTGSLGTTLTFTANVQNTPKDIFGIHHNYYSTAQANSSFEGYIYSKVSATKPRTTPGLPVMRGQESVTQQTNILKRRTNLASMTPQSRGFQVPGVLKAQTVGATQSFNDDYGNPIPATLRSVTTDSSNAWTLQVWVEDASWNGSLTNTVTQEMVDLLKEKFLKEGSDNDIFDWVTNVYGAPWGTHSWPSTFVQFADTNAPVIDILVLDVDQDESTNGGVIGFFYGRDNFKKTSGVVGTADSNERIMFYIDSQLLAEKDGDTWDGTDYWPQETVMTLAHEFQHMINFYQAYILNDVDQDTFINEMLSLATEDFVSEKLGIPGPAGFYSPTGTTSETITQGRIPFFNVYPETPVFQWLPDDPDDNGIPYVLRSYSLAAVYGMYILRNLGGVETLRAIQHTVEDEFTIDEAIPSAYSDFKYTFVQVPHLFAGVLASDKVQTSGGFTFNNGSWFESSLNGITYKVPSINFHKYEEPSFSQVGPWVYTLEEVKGFAEIPGDTTLMSRIKEDFLGTYTLQVEGESDTGDTLWYYQGLLVK